MDLKSQPSIAVIIINWNGYTLTHACLMSMRQVAYPNFKVILVDNGSEDGSGKKLEKEFPEIASIESKTNLGFTGGNNLGIQKALEKSFDYVMLLNNDTIVEPDFLGPLVDFLEKNSSYGAVQPKIMFERERNKIWNAGGGYFKWLGMSWSIGIGKEDMGQYQTSKDTAWITGCTMLIRSKVIREIGMFDPRFFAYYEDVDWSLRMKKHGYGLRYLPESKIYHVAGGSSKKPEKTKEGTVPPIIHYYRTRNHLFLIRNNANPVSFVLSLLYQTIKNSAFIIYLTLRGRFKKVKAIIEGQYDGLFEKRKT
jgi:GT2 family glycosyltransferase